MGVMTRRTARDAVFVGVAATVLAVTACSSGGTTPQPVARVSETVAIGELPGPFSSTATVPSPPTSGPTTTTTEPPPISAPFVDLVSDYRVLVIGDTAMAATTPRFDGTMCEAVTGLGWDVEIDAEPGRFVSFGARVLDERLGDGWDAAVVMFGHHLEATVDDFALRLGEVLGRLSPRPVVLFTVAELGDVQVQANQVIRNLAAASPNVVLVDWADFAAAEPDLLLDEGGPYPTDEGVLWIVSFTTAALGEVPGGEPGTCLESAFTDDSAIVL